MEKNWPTQTEIERQSVLEIVYWEPTNPEQWTYRLRATCLGPFSVVQAELSRFQVTAPGAEAKTSRQNILRLWEQVRRWAENLPTDGIISAEAAPTLECTLIVGGVVVGRYTGRSSQRGGQPAKAATDLDGSSVSPPIATAEEWLTWAFEQLNRS